MSSPFSVVAIIAAHNEGDVIDHVIRDLVSQGIDVYFIDDHSTDDTLAIAERHVGQGVIGVERLSDTREQSPGQFEWEQILVRKARIAQQLNANWFIHHDADEFRESPWPDTSLHAAIRTVDALGYSAIDFACFDFWPVHDLFRPGDDVREAFTFYSQSAPYDRVQIRCWKKTAAVVDLASSGGHDVQFAGRKVFPVRFILRHYPIRGQAHGERKIFRERKARFVRAEREKRWHVQYDDVQEGASFLRDPSTLTAYDPNAVRLQLTLRHREVEELEKSLESSRCETRELKRSLDTTTEELGSVRAQLHTTMDELNTTTEELERIRAQLSARIADAAALRQNLEDQTKALDDRTRNVAELKREMQGLRRTADEALRRIDDLHQSLSWRWTSPARAVYRVLTGKFLKSLATHWFFLGGN